MKIVFLGDSLIFGYGVMPNENWVSLIKKQGEVEVINKGINGNFTYEMNNRFESDVVNNNPEYVFLMGGSNDLIFNIGKAEDVIANIKKIINKAIEANIKIIIGIPLLTDGEMAEKAWSDGVDYNLVNEELILISEQIKEIEKEQDITVIDFMETFNNKVNQSNKEEYLIDGLHPKSKGQKLMFETFNEEFLKK